MDTDQLKRWFNQNKRDLPWRENLSPYKVWVSEIMLQQTQVSVVIPYFHRWMERFPTIEALAKAPLEEVIKAWEGLGYYSRARNLHEGAKFILEHYQGKIPNSIDGLKKIKGIGDYTVGAIRSFAFHEKSPAVDGNVLRVITRFYQMHDDISKAKTVQEIRKKVETILPDEEPWIISEAFIELGAKVCTKKPKCGECPLKLDCLTYKHNLSEQIPFKSTKIKYETLHRSVYILLSKEKILLKQGEKGKVMAGLYEFPFQEIDEEKSNDGEIILPVGIFPPIKSLFQGTLEKITHGFTRFNVHLYPSIHQVSEHFPVKGHDWFYISDLKKLPFSSGHRRIYQKLLLKKYL